MADSTPPQGSFFGRWSQRKAQAREATESSNFDEIIVQKVDENAENLVANNSINTRQKAENNLETFDKKDIDEKSPLPGPTLDDVAKLTAESDYSAFTAQSVDPQVRNAAMRKLFAGDPHFNVMDGLDVYIDDYSVGVPIPKAMLRQMVQARSLGLLDDDLEDQDKPSSADAPTALAANDTGPIHENADLQLQRDDAAGHSGAGERTAATAQLDPEPHPKPPPEPAGHAAEPGELRPG